MRKADYTLLATLLKSKIDFAREQKMDGYVLQFEALAYQFAQLASVNRTAFLRACGIES